MSDKPKMILVTHLDIWMLTNDIQMPGTGNQSLYNTLLGYANAGWEVHMLTTSTVCAHMPSIHPNVIVHWRPIQLWEMIAGAKRAFLRWLRPAPKTWAMDTVAVRYSRTLHMYSHVFAKVMGHRAVTLAKRLGNVDFIYGHEILGAVAGEIASQSLGVPLVTRFQGTDLCFLLKEPDKIRNFKVRVAAMTANSDLVIMANDGTMGNKVLDFLGVPEDRVRFYMNGVVKDEVIRPNVDTAGIRRKLGIADDEVFILHTGRVFRWKRIDRHLEVLHRIQRQTPKFKAVFIGDGPQMKEAKDLQAALGLQDRVAFLGALPHDQVMDYLNACDIYFSCYDLSNLSNSVIESCVCGNCIVTTAIGGTKDLLTDGINAVVVEKYDDVDAIADGMLKVMRDPHERSRLAEGALQRGQELKTWKERMEMEVADVRAVLAGRRRV